MSAQLSEAEHSRAENGAAVVTPQALQNHHQHDDGRSLFKPQPLSRPLKCTSAHRWIILTLGNMLRLL